MYSYMKILTWNVWDTPFWISTERHERMHRLGGFLKTQDPDIICLQESFDTKHRDMIYEALGKDAYHATDQDDLMRRVFMVARMDTTGGLVIFSKFPIKNAVFTPFKNPILSSIQERVGRKGYLTAEIETPNGPLLVINTHLYSLRSVHASGIRIYQLKQIFKATKSKREKMTSVLAGDMNEDALKNPIRFKEILRNEGFIDSTELVGEKIEPSYRPENPLPHTRFNNGEDPLRLDYVLFGNLPALGLRAVSNDVLEQPENPLSDHNPIMVTLK